YLIESFTIVGLIVTIAFDDPISMDVPTSPRSTFLHSTASQVRPPPTPRNTSLLSPGIWIRPFASTSPVRVPSLCVLPPANPPSSKKSRCSVGKNWEAANVPWALLPPPDVNCEEVPDASTTVE